MNNMILSLINWKGPASPTLKREATKYEGGYHVYPISPKKEIKKLDLPKKGITSFTLSLPQLQQAPSTGQLIVIQQFYLFPRGFTRTNNRLFITNKGLFVINIGLFTLNRRLFVINKELFALNRRLFVINKELFALNRRLFVINKELFALNRRLFAPDKGLSASNKHLLPGDKELLVAHRGILLASR